MARRSLIKICNKNMLQNVEEKISSKDANLRKFGKLPRLHAQHHRAKENQALDIAEKTDQQNLQNQPEEPTAAEAEVKSYNKSKHLTYKVQKRPYVPPKFMIREKSVLANLTPHWTAKGVQLFQGPENIPKEAVYNAEPFPKGYTIDMKLKSMNIPSTETQRQCGPYIPPVFFKPSRSQNQKQNMLISINNNVPPSLQQWAKKLEEDRVQIDNSEINEQVIKRRKKPKVTNQLSNEKYSTNVAHAKREKNKIEKITKSDKTTKSEKITKSERITKNEKITNSEKMHKGTKSHKSPKTTSNQVFNLKTSSIRGIDTNQSTEIFKNKQSKKVPKSVLPKRYSKINPDHKLSIDNQPLKMLKTNQETFLEENTVQNYVKEHFLSTYRNSKSYNIPKPPHLSDNKLKQGRVPLNKNTMPITTTYKLRVKPPLKSVFYKPLSPKKEKQKEVKEKSSIPPLDSLNVTVDRPWSFIEPQIPRFLSPAINDLKVIDEEGRVTSENSNKEKRNRNSIYQDNTNKNVSKVYQDLNYDITPDSPHNYIKRIEARYSQSNENYPEIMNQNDTLRENSNQLNAKVISQSKPTASIDQLVRNQSKLDGLWQKKLKEGKRNAANNYEIARTVSHDCVDTKRNFSKQHEDSEVELKRDYGTSYEQRSLSKHIINKPKQDVEQENENDWVRDAAAYSAEIQKSPGINFKRSIVQKKIPKLNDVNKNTQPKIIVTKEKFNPNEYWKLPDVMTEIEDVESPLAVNQEDFKVYLSIPNNNQYCGFRICNSNPFQPQVADL